MMAVVGVNFIEISGKRKEAKKVTIESINTNMKVTDVYEREVSNAKLLAFKFEFITEYKIKGEKKNFGELRIVGEILYMDEEKKLKEILKKWKKDKKIEPKILRDVLQAVSDNSLVEGIYLARKIGLPLPLRFPRVEVRK